MTTRRGFLGAMLAAAAAPALVRAASLMPVYVPPPPRILTLCGDGVHDDSEALEAALNGSRDVLMWDGTLCSGVITRGVFKLSRTVHVRDGHRPFVLADSVLRTTADTLLEVAPQTGIERDSLILSNLLECNGKPHSMGVLFHRAEDVRLAQNHVEFP